MKDHDKIDKYFSDHLKDNTVDYDKEQLWEKLEDKKPKRRLAWLWFLGIGLLLSAITGGYLWNNHGLQSRTLVEKAADSSIREEINAKSTKSDKNAVQQNKSSAQAINENVAGTGTNLNQDLPPSNIHEKSTNVPSNDEMNYKPVNSNNNRDGIEDDFNEPYVPPHINSSTDPQHTERENGVADKPIFLAKRSLTQEPPVILSRINHLDELIRKMPITHGITKSKILEDNTSRPFWIELSSTIYRNNTRYYHPDIDIQDDENNSKSDIAGTAMNVSLGYKILPTLSLTTGVMLEKTYEKFYWEDTSFKYNIEPDTNTRSLRWGVEKTVKKRQSLNHRTLIHIPVGLAYEKNWDKWGVGIAARSLIRVYQKNEGFAFNENYDDIIKKAYRNIDSGKSLLSYDGRLFMNYRVSKHTQLSMHGSFKWNPKRQTSNGVKYDYNQVGLGVGLRYTFH